MEGMEMKALAVTLISLSLFAPVASKAQTNAAKAPTSASIKISRSPAGQEGICRILHRLSTGSGALSCLRSIAHKRRKSYVRTRSAERMAYSPVGSTFDRDGRNGLGSAVGRSHRGNSKRRCRPDPSGSETLARRTPSTEMTHIAIQEQLNGKAVEWMEKVTDEQYRK